MPRPDLGSTHSAGVHDGQLTVDLAPISQGQRPLFRQFEGGRVQGLEQGVAAGEDAPGAIQAAVTVVQALNGVGGIDDLLDGGRELEHGADHVPVVLPAAHAAGILLLPDLGNGQHPGAALFLVRGVIDGFEVGGERLLVLVRHVPERVAHHVHDAPLVLRHRVRRRDCLFDSAQAVRAEHENILQAPIL